MTALSIPMWAIYYSGLRMQSRLPDPMKVGHMSVGNVGPLTYDAAQILKATFECPTNEDLNSSALNISFANATALPAALLCQLYANPELVGLTYFSMSSGVNITLTGEQAAYVLTFFDFVQMAR
jgi:hypothetical protein